jgi:hypothetical protein
VEPGEGALDDPAVAAKPGAVSGLTLRDLGRDAAFAEVAAVLLAVVGTVSCDALGAPPWSADPAAYGRDPVDEWDQLGAVVAVSARESPGERDPSAIDEEVVLRPVSGSINRARARLGAPFFA